MLPRPVQKLTNQAKPKSSQAQILTASAQTNLASVD